MRQRTGPGEQDLRQPGLADVEQQPAARHVHEQFRRQAQVPAEGRRQHAAVDGVAVGVAVAGAQGVDPQQRVGVAQQAFHHRLDGAADLLRVQPAPGSRTGEQALRGPSRLAQGLVCLWQLLGKGGGIVVVAAAEQFLG